LGHLLHQQRFVLLLQFLQPNQNNLMNLLWRHKMNQYGKYRHHLLRHLNCP
jgi:hypothetical protein